MYKLVVREREKRVPRLVFEMTRKDLEELEYYTIMNAPAA